MRAIVMDSLAHSIVDLLGSMAQQPESVRAFAAVVQDWERASDEERLRAVSFLFATFKFFENAWFQRRQGILDPEQWLGWDVYIRLYFHQPGVQTWWRLRKVAFAPGFCCMKPTMSGSERQRSIEISRATSDEAASIAAVLHQAFAEYQSLYTAEAFAITTPTPAEIEQRWNEGPIWSVVKDGRLVGTVAAVAKGDALYIRSMAVVPSARGQGIGEMLLVEVERFARAGGV